MVSGAVVSTHPPALVPWLGWFCLISPARALPRLLKATAQMAVLFGRIRADIFHVSSCHRHYRPSRTCLRFVVYPNPRPTLHFAYLCFHFYPLALSSSRTSRTWLGQTNQADLALQHFLFPCSAAGRPFFSVRQTGKEASSGCLSSRRCLWNSIFTPSPSA